MSDVSGALQQTEIGERLRHARERKGLRQAEAATEAMLARTTLIAIEQGLRKVRMDELRTFARIYDTSVNDLLRREAIRADLAPKFRKQFRQVDDSTEQAIQLLANLAQAEVELEQLMGISRVRNYPPERSILPGDVRAQAEQDALELRQWLGLGLSPIMDIITLLEIELGVRVYVRSLKGPISGLFAYDEQLGACMLLNADHPRERRTLTAAHELGHLVSTRRLAEVLDEMEISNSREERYSTAFAIAFLMPVRAVMQKFQEIVAASGKLTRRHIIVLAHIFGVSREAIVKRLEDLKLTKPGTWEWFVQNGGITDDQARQVLGDLHGGDSHKAEAGRPTTLRLALLAGEAFRRELLSEGQLARLLQVDRLELREMFEGLEIEGSEADGAILPD
jgi:Zn-dependent peptidase ImmA (M78 family)/DNA-binding XRE family transcriptional regulator